MGVMQSLRRRLNPAARHELMEEIRWLWRYVCRYRGTVCVHILLGAAGIIMGLLGSVASKYLIDAVTGFQSEQIGPAAALMIGMQLGAIAMRAITSRVSARMNIRVQNEIQAEVFASILDAQWEGAEAYRGGDLLNRLQSDTNTVAGGVTGFLPSAISSTIQCLGSFVIILRYDPVMAVISLLGLPMAALCSHMLVWRMRAHSQKLKALHSDVMSYQEDTLQNLTTVKAFGIAGQFQQRMTQMQQQYRGAYLDYNRFTVRTTAVMSLVGALVSACCFGWGVYRLWNGEITYGSMTMFLQLSSTLGSACSALIGLVPTAISITTSAGRVMAVGLLPQEERRPTASTHEADAIHLAEVCCQYRDQHSVALQQVSMTVQPGELVALVGPSGGGKTTLLRVILGLVTPSEGEACFLSPSGEKTPMGADTRSTFGYVPQGNTLFAGTIADNLRLTNPDATDAELWEALRLACADGFVSALPGGLTYRLGSRGRGLSEGQAQRVAIARALLRNAPVLLLDEATSALDEVTESLLLHNLMTSGRVYTCIVATHRPGVMQYCTRSYRVEQGRLIERPAEAAYG